MRQLTNTKKHYFLYKTTVIKMDDIIIKLKPTNVQIQLRRIFVLKIHIL